MGCCYDWIIKDTCTIINYYVHVISHIRCTTNNDLIKMLFCFFVSLIDSIRIIEITIIGL